MIRKFRISNLKHSRRIGILGVLLFLLLNILVLTPSVVFAEDEEPDSVVSENRSGDIIIYENSTKTLRITEISASNDLTSMVVSVLNINTGTTFRMEHGLDASNTSNEFIEITAADGLGNLSEMVRIRNPFYQPTVLLDEDEEDGVAVETQPSDESAMQLIFITNEPTNNNSIGESFDIEAILSNSNGFDTNGWATVVDNAIVNNKEFFIIRSETGNEFYIIVDRENERDNVYFLNAVTEWDLLGLAERYEVPNNLNPGTSVSYQTATQRENSLPEPSTDNNANNPNESTQNNQSAESDNNSRSQSPLLWVLILVGIGGVIYLLKIKPKMDAKKKASSNDNEDYYSDDDFEDVEIITNGNNEENSDDKKDNEFEYDTDDEDDNSFTDEDLNYGANDKDAQDSTDGEDDEIV